MAGRFSQRRYRAEHYRWQYLIAAEPGPALTNATGLRMFRDIFSRRDIKDRRLGGL
jgi:hypothetical protein